MTNFIKKSEIKNNWFLINAENAIVGRLAAYISTLLRGKNKNQYSPNMDNGDFVVGGGVVDVFPYSSFLCLRVSYLDEKKMYEANIELIFQDFEFKNYMESNNTFIPGLSVIDLINNVDVNNFIVPKLL